MGIRRSRLIVLALAVVAVSAATIAAITVTLDAPSANGNDDNERPSVLADTPPATADEPAQPVPITYDDLLTEIAVRIPGFGGIYEDPNHTNRIVILLDDPGKADTARQAVSDVLGDDFIGDREVLIRFADYDLASLNTWHQALTLVVMASDSVVYTDMDEGLNRVEVALLDPEFESEVRRIADTLNIPQAAIVISHSGGAYFAGTDNRD